MPAINVAQLELSSYGPGQGNGGGAPPISPEILGRIIACAWRAQTSGDANSFLTSDVLSRLILQHVSDMPSELGSILHIENRVDGNQVEETTDLLVGAQQVGVLGRLNPSNVAAILKADKLQAYALLDGYNFDYPEVVAWAKTLAKQPA